MDIASLILVLLLVLAPSAVLLLWLLNLRYRSGTVAAERSHWLIQAIASIVVIAAFAVVAVASLLTVGPGVLIIAAIILMMFTRYLSLERRSLLAVMAAAAGKGIPLEQAVLAFADERVGSFGAPSGAGIGAIPGSGRSSARSTPVGGNPAAHRCAGGRRRGLETGSLPEALDLIVRLQRPGHDAAFDPGEMRLSMRRRGHFIDHSRLPDAEDRAGFRQDVPGVRIGVAGDDTTVDLCVKPVRPVLVCPVSVLVAADVYLRYRVAVLRGPASATCRE